MKTRLSTFSAVFLAAMGVLLVAASAQAQFTWAKRVASTSVNLIRGGYDAGMALDTNGNCLATGCFNGSNDFGGVILTNQTASGTDMYVAKYSPGGGLQWVQSASGGSGSLNIGMGIGADTNGNVYVSGGFYGPAVFATLNVPGATGNDEFFLAKYNSAGAVQWVQSSSGGHGIFSTGMTVDGAGNCYALAFANNGASVQFGSTSVPTPANSSESMILAKYNTAGACQWAQCLGGGGEVWATKVAVDATGNVYVRGTFFTNLTIGASNLVVSTGATKNMFIAKFNNSGSLIWVQQPAGGNVDEGGVAVDQAENVYVTGWFSNSLNFGAVTLTNAGSFDAFIAKYNSSGVVQWASQAGGGTNLGFLAGYYSDVALDGQGNPYAAGALSPAPNSTNATGLAMVAKYNPAGALQWSYAASGPAEPLVTSVATKCAVDSAGNCYLAGLYQTNTTFGTNVLPSQNSWNYFLAKVPPGAASANNVTFSNTPAAVSNAYSGYITLQIGGLTNGETVVVQKYLDLNTNGMIDAGDWPVQQFTLTDGQAGMVIQSVTNFNVPGDTDGAVNGQITAALNFDNGDFVQNIAGNYLFRLSSPVGHFTALTNQFAVTNLPYAQKFTGSVVINGTSTVVPNALVILVGAGPSNPLFGGVANNAGGYALPAPPGTYGLSSFSSVYVSDHSYSPSLTLAAGQTIATNLMTLVTATGGISGSVVDAGTGTGLPGVVQTADSDSGSGQTGFALSDSNGNFSMPVTAGQWELGSQNVAALNVHGYVGWDNADYVNAGTTGVALAYPKATALIYGRVKDTLGNPVPGVELSAYDNNGLYKVLGDTDINGNYVLGVLGGLSNDPWSVGVANGPANYTFSGQTITGVISTGQAVLQNFTATNLTVAPLVVTTTSLPNGTNGVTYMQTLTASGGTAPYSWTNISGGLPAGLTLATNGVISGKPTGSGTTNFTVKVTDAAAATATQALTLSVVNSISVSTNLVLNGGFETGNFADWTTNGNFTSCFVNATYAHSGNYGAELGPVGTLAYLSQALATIPGTNYALSLWLENANGKATNEFLVSWNGVTLFDQVNLGATTWTNLLFNITATGSSTLLKFGFRNDASFFGLDDVSVTTNLTPPVALSAAKVGAGKTNFIFQLSGPAGGNYVLQVSTNLVNWTGLSTSTIPVSGSLNFTNVISSHNRQFYRVIP